MVITKEFLQSLSISISIKSFLILSVWEVDAISERGEVNGGIDGLVCNDHNTTDTKFDVALNDTRPIHTCQTLNVPDCEDRTIYCTFPPKGIQNGKIDTPIPTVIPVGYNKFIDGKRTVYNPNLDGYEHPTSKCVLRCLIYQKYIY